MVAATFTRVQARMLVPMMMMIPTIVMSAVPTIVMCAVPRLLNQGCIRGRDADRCRRRDGHGRSRFPSHSN